MKIGLYGGSFNPVHNAHIFVVESILKKNLVDEMWLIPCKDHPFAKDLAPFAERYEMLKLAFHKFHNVQVLDVENRYGGKSYTFETIRLLKKENPGNDFYFVMGTDVLGEFDKWRNYQELLKETKFIVHSRPGFDFKKISGMNYLLVNEHRDLSSTQVRNLVKEGELITNLVPKEVERYIYKNSLYKN